MTPGHVRTRTEDTPGTSSAARAHPRENGHLYTRTLEREHMMDTDTPTGHVRVTDADTPMGHVTHVTSGYLYQPWKKNGISPEPELYKCNTIPILVNIAKIVLTSWISI